MDFFTLLIFVDPQSLIDRACVKLVSRKQLVSSFYWEILSCYCEVLEVNWRFQLWLWVERSYIKEFRCFEAVKIFAVSSSIGFVEFRDKGFVLDLKFLFIIMDCFLGRFPPKFFTMKLICLIDFSESSYLLLFTIWLCMILN